jgi:hypothetical protein
MTTIQVAKPITAELPSLVLDIRHMLVTVHSIKLHLEDGCLLGCSAV